MWSLDYKYALYHNRKHQLGGHVFDGPYRAHRQKTVQGLFRRLAYLATQNSLPRSRPGRRGWWLERP